MNKRIKQLMDQAGIDVEAVENLGEMPTALKFAELIVRECADKAYKTAWDDLTHGYGQSVVPLHIHNDLLEHFGVQE